MKQKNATSSVKIRRAISTVVDVISTIALIPAGIVAIPGFLLLILADEILPNEEA